MQSRKSHNASAIDRRQRLQIGGGALAVAVIWILALWPAGDDLVSQSGPSAPVSPGPWTTGPFVGTTPTTEGQQPAAGSRTTATTTRVSPAVTTPPAPGAAPTTQAGVAPEPGVASTTSPVASTQPAPEEGRTPPGKANKTTRPPKALDISDVLNIG